jgi:hypothetical protein
MALGSWEVNVILGGMPEKLATAIGQLNEQIVGAEYTPIAYLGSQLVNGTNHAVLAEQLLLTGKDTKNVVLLIFNEKGMNCTLVNIERVVEGGNGLGAVDVDVKTDIPADAQVAFNNVLGEFVGATIKPFALLATQVVKGINYVFAAEVDLVTEVPVKKVAIVTVNSLEKKASFADILKSDLEIALGKPLGEWP